MEELLRCGTDQPAVSFDKLAMPDGLFDNVLDPFGLDGLLDIDEPWFTEDANTTSGGENSSSASASPLMPQPCVIKQEEVDDFGMMMMNDIDVDDDDEDEIEYGDCLSNASSPLDDSPPSPIATITISSEELFLNSNHSSMELHNYSSSRSTRSTGGGSKSSGSPSSSTTSSPNARKSGGRGSGRGKPITELSLTEEEKRLLSKEGYAEFPAGSIPLTKQEEKILRKVRRKIRNKRSAQCSRQRKKEYVEELEKKFEKSISENDVLRKEVLKLKRENNNLLVKMKNLVTGAAGQTSLKTSFFVLVLSFLLILVPFFRPESMEDNLGLSVGSKEAMATGRHLLSMALSGDQDAGNYYYVSSGSAINDSTAEALMNITSAPF